MLGKGATSAKQLQMTHIYDVSTTSYKLQLRPPTTCNNLADYVIIRKYGKHIIKANCLLSWHFTQSALETIGSVFMISMNWPHYNNYSSCTCFVASNKIWYIAYSNMIGSLSIILIDNCLTCLCGIQMNCLWSVLHVRGNVCCYAI